MYKWIFHIRQLRFINYIVMAFGVLGLALLFKRKEDKKQRIFLLSFLFGAFTYWIINSKVIFFHNYYSIHIIYVYFMLAAFFIDRLFKKANQILKLLSFLFYFFQLIKLIKDKLKN